MLPIVISSPSQAVSPVVVASSLFSPQASSKSAQAASRETARGNRNRAGIESGNLATSSDLRIDVGREDPGDAVGGLAPGSPVGSAAWLIASRTIQRATCRPV